jgi:hypothetical protein
MQYKQSPDEPRDFGFHYPWEYLRRVCPIVIASNYVTFPEAETKGLQKAEPSRATARGLAFDEL